MGSLSLTVTSSITEGYCAPKTIQGKTGDEFDVFVAGTTSGTGENVIWIDIQEVSDSRVPGGPWGAGVNWYFTYTLQLTADLSPGDYNLTLRTGHVENGQDVVDDTKTVTFTVGEIVGVHSKITNGYSDPAEISGQACTNFTVYVEGLTYDAAGETATIWTDIMEVSGSRAQTDTPIGPSQTWSANWGLHVEQDIKADYIVLTLRTGHVEGTTDVVDDLYPIVITITGAPTTLTIQSATGGTTNPPPGTYQYNYGEKVTVTAIPDYKYNFEKWIYDSYESTVNPITLTMTQNYTLTPSFKQVTVPSGICFIATAAYGTPLAPQLDVFRKFRDCCLPEKLTETYYKLSPPLAEFIRRHSHVRCFVKQSLQAVYELLRRR